MLRTNIGQEGNGLESGGFGGNSMKTYRIYQIDAFKRSRDLYFVRMEEKIV